MNEKKIILQLQAQLQKHLSTDQKGNITGIEESAQACAGIFNSALSMLMQEIEQRIRIHQSKAGEYKETSKHSLRLASEGKITALQELRTDLSILYGMKLETEG